MTTYGLTSTGFRPKSTEVVLGELRDAAKGIFGANINTQSDSLLGMLLALCADRESELWDLAQSVYAGGDPDQARGDQLAGLAALSGTLPRGATSSTTKLSCTGTPGTPLSTGRIAAVSGSPSSRFATSAPATIAAAAAWVATTGYAVGDVVTHSSKIYVCTTAGTSAGSGGPTGTGTDIVDGTVHWRYVGDGTGYVAVDAKADTMGPVVGNAFSITLIGTPVSGWSNVTNLLDAVVGTNLESDAALRVRRVAELAAAGAGRLEAIRAKLVKVTGVIDVDVFENTGDVVDGGGRPAHSVQAVLEQSGAAAADIAAALFNSVDAGIQTYGAQSLAVTDSKGNSHTMSWDNATVVPIWIVIDIDAVTAEFPADGVAQIKNDIIEFGDALPIGRDVIAQKIKALVWAVAGVYDVTSFDIGTSNPPAGEANVTIAATSVADFDTSRITVNVNFVTPG